MNELGGLAICPSRCFVSLHRTSTGRLTHSWVRFAAASITSSECSLKGWFKFEHTSVLLFLPLAVLAVRGRLARIRWSHVCTTYDKLRMTPLRGCASLLLSGLDRCSLSAAGVCWVFVLEYDHLLVVGCTVTPNCALLLIDRAMYGSVST
jgi:hypothetical protein